MKMQLMIALYTLYNGRPDYYFCFIVSDCSFCIYILHLVVLIQGAFFLLAYGQLVLQGPA